ncbi:MAG: efflux RND transporter periplasmic adaptor subunit [Verrucomicrobia bacterium]|nr:efflux RND transporter periplasmic adaptor subunit [Verrucomicrobiota bacterium]
MKLTRSKLIGFLVITVFAVAAAVFFMNPHHSGNGHAVHSDQLYTCGMHPQVIQNKPGNCPICGMKLTPVRKQPGTKDGSANTVTTAASDERKVKYYKSTMLLGEISQAQRKDSMGMDMVPVYEDEAADSSTISIDPVTVQNMGIRTGVVTKGPLRRSIRSVGVVDFDETTLADVTTKFKGWIEKLYVDATGKQAHKGEGLFEIYSPELVSAQTEYLLALNQTTGVPGTESLRATALTKLKFFDISDEQIAELEKTRQAKKTLRVSAPRDGIVVEKMAVEGQMVDAGMKLYRLADLGIVWVQAQVYEQDLAFVRLGQEATVSLSYLPDRKFRGRVTYVYPTVDEKTRTARVRMEFHNPGYFLKPGMFATVELQAELEPSALLVPDMAVLRSGEKNTVFIALAGGKFEPRTVTLGPRSENNFYQVLSGLNEGERVVTSGQFMLDSESQLREAIQKMLQPGSATATNEHAGHGVTSTNATTAAASSDIVYICPMPEHVALKYPKPGKCPLCGMALVPVTAELLAKIQPGGRVEHYTCPMPEHSDVKLDKPGKCPRCGMTLIPMMLTPPPPPPKAPVPEGHQH